MFSKYNKKDWLFLSVIVMIHAIFFLLALHFKRIYMGDSFEYIYEALNIKKYFFFYSGNPAMPIVTDYMTLRPPGYPLFLLMVYLFTINNWIIVVLQNIISIFNICYIRKALLQIGYQKKYDWLLLSLTIAYPAQFIYANTLAPDILLQTFVVIYFYQFIRLLRQRNWKHAIYMSLVLIVGMLVKPVLYPFVILHLILLLIVAIHQKVKLQRPLVIAIIPIFAILFYNYWNYTRTGKFHFSSTQSFNAIFYYAIYFTHKKNIGSADTFLRNERAYIASLPDFKEQYDYANDRGMELLKYNFIPYIAFHLQNSARIFIEPGKAEIDLFTGDLTYGRLYSRQQTGFYATLKQKGLLGLGAYFQNNRSMPFVIVILILNCIKLIGLFVFLFSRNINIYIRLFVFVLLCYIAIAAGPIANTRYFLPVSLMAIGCAIIGYQQMIERKKSNLYQVNS